MTGHTTNKAFDRYIQLQGEALKGLYSKRQTAVAADNGLTMENRTIRES
ncbi:hypothetical protein FACS189460_4990 [Deltaproteobacteria bacterium]|nr:hypothetical protein FACS189460_4990 [Deltaproteobacteria bacterium]